MRSLSAVLALLLAVTLAACSPSPETVRKDAEAAFMSYVAAINAGDVETAAALYDVDPDFYWVERGGIQYDNAEDAQNALKEYSMGGGISTMTVDDVRVADLGPKGALVSANFTFVMADASGTPVFSFGGWISTAMVKRGGKWLIAAGHTTTEAPD